MSGEQVRRASILEISVWEKLAQAASELVEEAKIIPIGQRVVVRGGGRSRIPYHREDIEVEDDDTSSHSDAKRIQAPQAEIMYGGAGDAIDRLSTMDRILYESQEFITTGGFSPNLFKMRDEIGMLRATVKKKDKNGKLIPVAFAEPGAGGMDIDAKGLFDPESDLVDMVDRYANAKWADLKRDQRANEYQQDAWQTHAPALLTYLSDILPDHPMDAASPVLLEPGGQFAQIFVPEHEARAIALLYGVATMSIIDESNIEGQLLEDRTTVVEVDGPCHIIIEVDEDEINDALLVVGRPAVDDGRLSAMEDLQLRAMAATVIPRTGQVKTATPIDASDEDPDQSDLFSEEGEADEEEFGIRVFPGRVGVLPDISELGSDIPSDWEEQVKLYQKETAGTISLAQWRVRRKLKRLDDELSVRMDSAYIGRGYVPPQLRWERIAEEEQSSSHEAAEKRAEMAESLLRTAKKIDSPQKMQSFRERIYKLNQADKALVNLWAPKTMLEQAKNRFVERLANERVKRIRCNICGTIFTHSPKYATYLSAYKYALGHEETELRERLKEAEEQNRTASIKQIKQELAALYDVPPHKIACWHKHDRTAEQMLGDNLYTVLRDDPLTAVQSTTKLDESHQPVIENVLKKKVWHWFDRRRKTVPSQTKFRLRCPHCRRAHDRTCSFDDLKTITCPGCTKGGPFKIENSILQSKAEFHDDSRWWKDRTEAFQNLNATQSQWNTIYKQLWIQQDRMQQCYLMQHIRGEKAPLHERKAQWKQDRDLMWDALKSSFKAQTTLHELEIFEESLSRQVVANQLSEKEKAKLLENGEPIPQPGDITRRSPLDHLTFGDELKIRIAIEHKKVKIAEDRKASAALQLHQRETISPTVTCINADTCENECLGKSSLEAWCYRCNTPSVGKPNFGLLDNGKGFLYIECINEACKSKIAIGAHNGQRPCIAICPKA